MIVPQPNLEKSKLILGVEAEPPEHLGTGDMFPVTWGKDGHLYTAAGDNWGMPKTTFTPMNVYVVRGVPGHLEMEELHHLPIDPQLYCRGILVDLNYGIKPASLLAMNGVLYMSVENINYGDNPRLNRQHNLNGWIITSHDNGRTWDPEATFQTFFTGRTASAHFVQFGQDYAGARDGYVYAHFPCALDGQSYWCNNDHILIGRVPRERLLDRRAWEFLVAFDSTGQPCWDADDTRAIPIFSYPGFTGENHVAYNPGLRRYIMGNYGFYNQEGRPQPYHQPHSLESWYLSQLTLYEAPEPWGPWRLFWELEGQWGEGNYQPAFPTQWMSADGRQIVLVCSGPGVYASFTTQRLRLKVVETE